MSLRAMGQKMRQKHVDPAMINTVIQEMSARSETDPDWQAALNYARRRRLGPWRRTNKDQVIMKKELAAMARAGFSYNLANKIIDADISDLEVDTAGGDLALYERLLERLSSDWLPLARPGFGSVYPQTRSRQLRRSKGTSWPSGGMIVIFETRFRMIGTVLGLRG